MRVQNNEERGYGRGNEQERSGQNAYLIILFSFPRVRVLFSPLTGPTLLCLIVLLVAAAFGAFALCTPPVQPN